MSIASSGSEERDSPSVSDDPNDRLHPDWPYNHPKANTRGLVLSAGKALRVVPPRSRGVSRRKA
ncbi:MAG: hypothetical protein AAGD07_10535 [Planctomycetota bacterium]